MSVFEHPTATKILLKVTEGMMTPDQVESDLTSLKKEIVKSSTKAPDHIWNEIIVCGGILLIVILFLLINDSSNNKNIKQASLDCSSGDTNKCLGWILLEKDPDTYNGLCNSYFQTTGKKIVTDRAYLKSVDDNTIIDYIKTRKSQSYFDFQGVEIK